MMGTIPDSFSGALLLSAIDFLLSFVFISFIGVVLHFFPLLNRLGEVRRERTKTMDQLFLTLMNDLLHQTGLLELTLGNLAMIVAGVVLLYLGIIKKYEPFLLVGIGFSCIVANVPGSTLTSEGGLFYFAYQGVEQLILPPLIFLGVGAMTDFGPMIANPSLVILGAAAHLGIFVALIGAQVLGFNLGEAASIGIIGGADGPMAIYTTMKLAPHLLPQISVAAYSYMALMPLIQPPIMKLLTNKEERKIMMKQPRYVSRLEKLPFLSSWPSSSISSCRQWLP